MERNWKWKQKAGKRLGRRLTALFLAALLVGTPVFSLCSEVKAASVENPWDGKTLTMPELDENGTYLIRTGAELAWFAAEVNRGNGEINGRLEQDIYLNSYHTSYRWIMIGDTQEHPYKGIFDGNGQRVVYLRTEISLKDPDRRYAGLFGVIDGGTVKNVTVLGKVFQNYGNYETDSAREELYAGSGGIAGYLKSGQITGCVNYARTTMEGNAMYRNSGGVVGICSGLVTNCENYGKLSTTISFAQNHTGGIAGLVYGIHGQVTNCVNHATVQGYLYVGGIAGAVKSGAEVLTSANYGSVRGNGGIGGIAGRLSSAGVYSDGTAKQAVIRNVYNLGNVDGFGTSIGHEIGGIVGEMGYDQWKQEVLPPMPVLEHAYSAVVFNRSDYSYWGGAIGYLKSGAYGTIYALADAKGSLRPVGAVTNRGTTILGESRMVKEDELKSAALLEKLGSAFVMSGKHDTENNGYPKLAWQSLPEDLLAAAAEAKAELNGWLTESNRNQYGKTYAVIEGLVKTYIDQIDASQSLAQIETIMTEAREKLSEVKPGEITDTDLAEAIDNAVIALNEYYKKILSQNEGLSRNQLDELEALKTKWSDTIEHSSTEEEVRLNLRDGRDALDEKLLSYEADKRLEEVRQSAIQTVSEYRAEEQYEVTWMFRIRQIREKALENITKAKTTADITSLMEQAKFDMDAIIDQIPETGAWDGVTCTVPDQNADGIYQITSGAELAWFAKTVNDGETDISAELCNDISLGAKSWTPIGAEKPFIGSFDGGGHTVRSLYINTYYTYDGLFGYVAGGNGQRIQNVTVTGTIKADGRTAYVGGIAGYAQGNGSENRYEILNCKSLVSISVENIRPLDAGVAGIVGKTRYVRVSGCGNEGSISIPSEGRGGITYFAGGLIGSMSTGSILELSYNIGQISSCHTAGGLVGSVIQRDCQIRSCYNTGDVTGYNHAGGIGGWVQDSSTQVDWCYTSGPVNLKHSGLSIGAVFGTVSSGSFGTIYALKRSDLVNRALVGTSADFTAAGKFLTEKELQSDDILNALNGGGSVFIHDYLGYQNGYPILSWQMTLEQFKTGAISELQNFVPEADYTAENWAAIQAVVSSAAEKIRAAEDMEGVNAVLTSAKTEILAVETKDGTAERQLNEAKDAAIETLENYVDLTNYREEEQAKIRNLVANARKNILLADEMEEVQRLLDEARQAIDRLPDAWQVENQRDMAAAAQVDGYIMSIGEVVYTAYVKTSIELARLAYDNLTEKQRGLVSVYQTLLDAEAEWERLAALYEPTEEDTERAAQVDLLIGAIGTVGEESGDAIRKARLAFDALTEKQKTLVERAGELDAAEQAYNKLKADGVSAAIAAIGEVTLEKEETIFAAQRAYDALTDVQKALVTTYPVLQRALEMLQDLTAVRPVLELIDAIGEVTLESKNAIDAAVKSYNGLTGNQQALVSNYEVLEQAVDRYQFLYGIQHTIDLIGRIGTVSRESGPQIAEARAAYNALSPAQQSQITNFEVLEHAEEAYAALETPTVDPGTETTPIRGGGREGTVQTGGNGKAGTAGQLPAADLPAEDGMATDLSGDTAEETEAAAETGFPDWLEAQLTPEQAVQAESKILEQLRETGKERRRVLILGVIFGALALVTAAAGAALLAASKKRRSKHVRF